MIKYENFKTYTALCNALSASGFSVVSSNISRASVEYTIKLSKDGVEHSVVDSDALKALVAAYLLYVEATEPVEKVEEKSKPAKAPVMLEPVAVVAEASAEE